MAALNPLPPLPPGFTIDQPQIDRPVIRKGPKEAAPRALPAPPRPPLTTEEKQKSGLPESEPYFWGDNGIPTLPGGYKPPDAADNQAQKQQSLDAADALVQGVRKARSFVNDAETPIIGNAATGLGYSLLHNIPATDAAKLDAVINQEIRGNIFLKRIADLKLSNDSPTGGTGIGRIMQAEIPLITGALGALDPAKLGKQETLNSLGQIERSALRTKAAINGENPDDPAVIIKYGIPEPRDYSGGAGVASPPPALPPSSGDGGERPPALRQGDGGITPGNPLPPLRGVDSAAVSTDQKIVVDPALAKIAGQLTTYMNADPTKVTNGMIVGFMRKNGVDPSTTNVGDLLRMRATGKYKGFTVDPRTNVPLSGVKKAAATVTGFAPAATAAVAGAADAATLGAIPDLTGIVNAVTGLGPSRADAISARDALATAEPGATVAGALAGGFLPLGGAGEASAITRALRAAAAGGLYGFLGSDRPDIPSRLSNAGEGGLLALLTHGAIDSGGGLLQGGYRAAARPVQSLLLGPEATADRYALSAAARKMPAQSLAGVEGADAAARAAGVPAPAAASIDRAGQDYLARVASGSPAARAVADQVAADSRKAIPKDLAADFNAAIEAAAPEGVDASAYLNRPVREIAADIQGMAGREYEQGLAPIAKEKMTITPELGADLEHERVSGAIRDALANHNLDAETRNQLRELLPQLKTLAGAPTIAREAYSKGIPLSVDGARNIATALNRTAGKLADGSEGQVELSRLSRDIRGAIGDQFPEYVPVNARYASRMRAIEAMQDARRNFFASTPDQADALAKSSRKFTEEPNPPEYGTERAPLPSNRQLAAAGAREAAQVQAGESGAATIERLASNINQGVNSETVLGGAGARIVAARAAQRAKNAAATDRIGGGGTADQTEGWFNKVKTLVAMKATGGMSHYTLAHAAASVPGFSSRDAARVVRLYLDADSAPQVLQSLSKAYGARRARFIMARMGAVAAAAIAVRGVQPPPGP